jgi:ankyrin repeat protein
MNSDPFYPLNTVREAICRGDAEYVQKAIDAGFDPNTQDSKGRTPLIFAAQFQHPAIVRLLLTHGANPLHKDLDGYDASDTAAFFGEWRMSAYTAESAVIQAILRAHVESPNRRLFVRLLAWLKHVFLT